MADRKQIFKSKLPVLSNVQNFPGKSRQSQKPSQNPFFYMDRGQKKRITPAFLPYIGHSEPLTSSKSCKIGKSPKIVFSFRSLKRLHRKKEPVERYRKPPEKRPQSLRPPTPTFPKRGVNTTEECSLHNLPTNDVCCISPSEATFRILKW